MSARSSGALNISCKWIESEIEGQTKNDLEIFRQKHREYQEKWLGDHAGICPPFWCLPISKEKIPLEGYWRVPGKLREWQQVLEVKDIEAAVKKVKIARPFNQQKVTAWVLQRKGEI
jgi:hypothetical protein